MWGRRVFLTAATSDQPMKPPSVGVDFSNEYLAELRKQGLSSDEANKRLYQRDREMPDEIVIRLMLYCHDLETGKKLWERQLHHGRPAGGRHSKNSFASETPITDGERIYVYLTEYGLFAYDFDGKPTWATPLKPHGTTRDWGTGASPALHKRSPVHPERQRGTELRRGLRYTHRQRSCGERLGPCNRRGKRDGQRRSSGSTAPARSSSRSAQASPSATVSTAASCGALNRMGGVAIQSPFAWNDLLFVTSGSGADDNKPVVAVRAGGSGDITPPEAENQQRTRRVVRQACRRHLPPHAGHLPRMRCTS